MAKPINRLRITQQAPRRGRREDLDSLPQVLAPKDPIDPANPSGLDVDPTDPFPSNDPRFGVVGPPDAEPMPGGTPTTEVGPAPGLDDPDNVNIPYDEPGTIGPPDAVPTDTGLIDEAGWDPGDPWQDLPISPIDFEYMNPQVKAALEKLLGTGVRDTAAEEAAAARDVERGLGQSLAGLRSRAGFGGQFISGAASAQEGDLRSRAVDQLVQQRLGIQKGARDDWARDLGLASNAFDSASGRTVQGAGLKLQAEEGAADRALNAYDSAADRSLSAFDSVEDRKLAAAELGITQAAFDAILAMMNEKAPITDANSNDVPDEQDRADAAGAIEDAVSGVDGSAGIVNSNPVYDRNSTPSRNIDDAPTVGQPPAGAILVNKDGGFNYWRLPNGRYVKSPTTGKIDKNAGVSNPTPPGGQ